MDLEHSNMRWHPKGADDLWAKQWARAESMNKAIDLCEKRNAVIQAGGCTGAWPLWLSKRFATVLTFEPEMQNYTCLRRNLELTTNVTCYLAAVTDGRSKAHLKISQNPAAHQITTKPGLTQTLSIDNVEPPACDLIVLRVEGAELLAVKGAIATMAKYKPVVMLEDRGKDVKKNFGYDSDDLHDYMVSLNYRLKDHVRNDKIWAHKSK